MGEVDSSRLESRRLGFHRRLELYDGLEVRRTTKNQEPRTKNKLQMTNDMKRIVTLLAPLLCAFTTTAAAFATAGSSTCMARS